MVYDFELVRISRLLHLKKAPKMNNNRSILDMTKSILCSKSDYIFMLTHTLEKICIKPEQNVDGALRMIKCRTVL